METATVGRCMIIQSSLNSHDQVGHIKRTVGCGVTVLGGVDKTPTFLKLTGDESICGKEKRSTFKVLMKGKRLDDQPHVHGFLRLFRTDPKTAFYPLCTALTP